MVPSPQKGSSTVEPSLAGKKKVNSHSVKKPQDLAWKFGNQSWVAYASFAAFLALWWYFVPFAAGARCVMSGAGFMLIEFFFRGVNTTLESSPPQRSPAAWIQSVLVNGWTTWAMFFVIAGWAPLATEIYFEVFPNPWVRVALYPLNAWLCELVTGAYMYYVWGGLRPWIYEDSWACVNGFITFSFVHYWAILGFLHNYAVAYVYTPLSLLLEESLSY